MTKPKTPSGYKGYKLVEELGGNNNSETKLQTRHHIYIHAFFRIRELRRIYSISIFATTVTAHSIAMLWRQ